MLQCKEMTSWHGVHSCTATALVWSVGQFNKHRSKSQSNLYGMSSDGEMIGTQVLEAWVAQESRGLDAPSEDLSLVSNTHVRWL